MESNSCLIMKCAKLQLQERTKPEVKPHTDEKPLRYCQKRMVNPEHEENSRWTDVLDRSCYHEDKMSSSDHVEQNRDDLCLTVQNLQFTGNIQERKRPRTCFKYRTPHGNKHRMFVKEAIDEFEQIEMGRVSELSTYYYDDYTKYYLTQSRQSSRESSVILFDQQDKENKGTQADISRSKDMKKKDKTDAFTKSKKEKPKNKIKEENNEFQEKNIDDSLKISFHKYGKRKSLTISRADSPATVQVIRVDVVCNYSTSSALSNYDENVHSKSIDLEHKNDKNNINSRITNKYLLTNSVKTLDENVKGGKVTLLCKTFKLSNRLKLDKIKKTDEKKSKQQN